MPLKLKILAIDNHPLVLRLISTLLEKKGHQVICAQDGIDALTVLDEITPDLIFIDLVMPNISGEKLCSIIRNKKKFDNTYLVIISAIVAEDDFKFFEFGADACIAKGPFDSMSTYILDIVNKLERGLKPTFTKNILGIEAVYKRDITRELLTTKKHFETIINNISEGIFELNENLQVVYVNKAAQNILNKSESQILTKPFMDLFTIEVQRKLAPLNAQINSISDDLMLEEPISIIGQFFILNILSVDNLLSKKFLVLMKNVTDQVHSTKKKENDYNEIKIQVAERTRALLTSNFQLKHEIEERQRFEEALRKSEEKYHTIFKNIQDVYFETTIEGRIIEVSPSLEKASNFKREDLMGIYIFEKFQNQNRFNELITLLNQKKKVTDEEVIIMDKKGGPQYCSINASLIQDEITKQFKIVGSLRNLHRRKIAEKALKKSEDKLRKAHDQLEARVKSRTAQLNSMNLELEREIDERKKIEEQLQNAKLAAESATHSKSEFIANMSHEIRTPLNAITGLTNLLLKTNLDEKQSDYLEKLSSSSDVLLKIINDILDISKMEAGKLALENLEFNLQDVIDNLADMFSGKTVEKDIEIILSIAPNVPTLLIGDPLRLGQILINLINNAIKFTHEGEVVLEISIVEQIKGCVSLQFKVSDTGIGISQDHISKLFSAFTQADGSMARKYGGTGLGLTICKKITELMHGQIWVESEIDQGSTFFVQISFNIQPEKFNNTLNLPAEIQGSLGLIVDDNPVNCALLSKILSYFGLKTVIARHGEEALEILVKHNVEQKAPPFSFVIMDWRMPKLNGIEATRLIRLHNKMMQLPILMMTAFGREKEIREAESAGVDIFLYKPIKQRLLYNAIMTLFGYKSSEFKNQEGKIFSRQEKPVTKLKNTKILLVEDSHLNLQVAMEILEEMEIIVEVAMNGKEAVSAIKKNRYDAVLMDIQMPIMDGIEATKKIRGMPQFSNLPIIAMTAHAMSGDREKCIEMGMNDYVTKPFNADALSRTLMKWITKDEKINLQPLTRSVTKVCPNGFELNLPALPGINVISALKRLNGNQELLLTIATDFYDRYKNIIEKIQLQLNDTNNSNLLQLIHTLKGEAGNLSAENLHQLSSDFEHAILHDTSQKHTVFDDLKVELQNVCQSILQLKNHYNKKFKKTSDNLDKTVTDANQQMNAFEIIDKLIECLDNNSVRAEDYYSQLKSKISGDFSEELSRLEFHIRNFEYDDGKTILLTLSQKLDASKSDA